MKVRTSSVLHKHRGQAISDLTLPPGLVAAGTLRLVGTGIGGVLGYLVMLRTGLATRYRHFCCHAQQHHRAPYDVVTRPHGSVCSCYPSHSALMPSCLPIGRAKEPCKLVLASLLGSANDSNRVLTLCLALMWSRSHRQPYRAFTSSR